MHEKTDIVLKVERKRIIIDAQNLSNEDFEDLVKDVQFLRHEYLRHIQWKREGFH